VDNCVDEVLHYTVNSSRLRVQAVDDSAAVFQYPAGNDVVELVFVADIEDTNLLLVVVDGRRSVAETVGTSHRQVVTQFYMPFVISTTSSCGILFLVYVYVFLCAQDISQSSMKLGTLVDTVHR